MAGSEGIKDEEVARFFASLERRGAGSYTRRSYELALRDFSRFLARRDRRLEEVERRDIEDYITDFAAASPAGARPPTSTNVLELSSGAARPPRRAPRTVNHRLSVLSSFFDDLIRRARDEGGCWAGRPNPVPQSESAGRHLMTGRDRPPRGRRAELRRREPRPLPREVDPVLAERLITEAASARDRAILLLLVRTGQRIGDWSAEHGRHGILGMRLCDFDRRRSAVVVVLKGARDEHRVPVTEDFWPAFDRYLLERGEVEGEAAWIGKRRGQGKPLTYDAFDASLRALTTRLGVGRVNAHQFRHTLANQLVTVASMKVAQEVLGHRHFQTTADEYVHADQEQVALALADAARRTAARDRREEDGGGFVFPYDAFTIAELDAISSPKSLGER